MNLNLGIHLSVPSDIIPSIKIGNSLQIMFNKNKLNNDDIKNIKKILITNKKNNYKFVFIHSSYLINMASDFLTSSNTSLNGLSERSLSLWFNILPYPYRTILSSHFLYVCSTTELIDSSIRILLSLSPSFIKSYTLINATIEIIV